MKRSEYIDNYDGGGAGAKLHRAYYGQFVTDAIRALVKISIGTDKIVNSRDLHFNDVSLHTWDALVPRLPGTVVAALKEAGDYLSLGTGVCILKEAAEQIREAKGS